MCVFSGRTRLQRYNSANSGRNKMPGLFTMLSDLCCKSANDDSGTQDLANGNESMLQHNIALVGCASAGRSVR